MTDFSKLSDEELMRIAGIKLPDSNSGQQIIDIFDPDAPDATQNKTPDAATTKDDDMSKLSDEELQAIAGIEQNKKRTTPGATDTGYLRTILDNLLQGSTMGAADEPMDLLGATVAKYYRPDLFNDQSIGDLYNEAHKDSQARLANQFEEHPATALLSQLAGGIGGAFALGMPANLTKAAASTSKLRGAINAVPEFGASVNNWLGSGNTLRRAPKAASLGIPSMSLYGFNSGEDGTRLETAKKYAPLGLIPAALPIAGTTASALKNALQTVGTAVKPPPAQIGAYEKIMNRLNDDNITLEGLQSRLANLPQGSAMIDAGRSNLERLAEATANVPGEGATNAVRFVSNRASGASKRIKNNISDYIASGDLSTIADDLMKKGELEAQPLYKAAHEANKNMMTPEISQILETPAGKKALASAREKMQNDRKLLGLPDKELKEQMELAGQYESGMGGVASGLKLRTLDYVKRSLDDQIGSAIRAGEKDNARILTGLKNDLLDAMDNADVTATKDSPGLYKQARATWSGMMQGQNALEAGRDFTKLDTSELKKMFAKMSPTEQDLFKVGVAQNLKDTIGSTADRSNIARKLFGKEEYRDNLKAILSKKDYDKLRLSMMREEKQHLMGNRLLGNSRTALRSAEIEDLTDLSPEIAKTLLTGNPGNLLQKYGIDQVVNRFKGLNRETSGKISSILYEKDPLKQKQFIEEMKKIQQNKNKRSPLKMIIRPKEYYEVPKINLPGAAIREEEQ